MASVSVEIIGGLGNQLFGIAWARYLELKYCHTVNLISAKQSSGNNTHGASWDGWEVFGKEVFTSSPSMLERSRQVTARLGFRRSCRVVEEVLQQGNWESLPERAIIRGYFQTDVAWRFLQSRNLLAITPPRIGSATQPPTNCPELAALPESSFVHFRFGDYEHVPGFAIDRSAYYSHALATMLKVSGQTKIVNVFSDDHEKAAKLIHGASAAHPDVAFLLSNRREAGIPHWELINMSRHPVGIIANSTFSLWAGLLAGPDARIFYPEPWFDDESLQSPPHVPSEWFGISWKTCAEG